MNVHGQFNRDFNKAKPKYKRPDFKSQTAGELWDYFEEIRYASEQNLILSDTAAFENAIIELTSSKSINRGGFIKNLTALSYALNGARPTDHKKWELFHIFGKHLPDLDRRIQDHLQGTSPTQITKTAMAFKRLKTKPSDKTATLIERQFLHKIQSANIFDISNTIDSMAFLAHVPSERFINALEPRIKKRKNSTASTPENRKFRQTLQALATMQAISQSSGLDRPEIRSSALKILDFLKNPKTDIGLNQVVKIDTQFEFGLNSEATEEEGGKSKQEEQFYEIFNTLVEKMPELSWRKTPNRILNVTHMDVDYALSYDNGKTQTTILGQYEGSDHFLFGTRPDGSFGEVSWNGSTILNSSNTTKLCPDAVVIHIPYFVYNEAIKLDAGLELVRAITQNAIDVQAGQYDMWFNGNGDPEQVHVALSPLEPEIFDITA